MEGGNDSSPGSPFLPPVISQYNCNEGIRDCDVDFSIIPSFNEDGITNATPLNITREPTPTQGNHSTDIFQDCNVDFWNIPSFNEDGIADAAPLNIASDQIPTHGNHSMGIFQDCDVDFSNIISFDEDGSADAMPPNISSDPIPWVQDCDVDLSNNLSFDEEGIADAMQLNVASDPIPWVQDCDVDFRYIPSFDEDGVTDAMPLNIASNPIPTHGNHSTSIFQDCNVDFRNIPSFNEGGITDATPFNITSDPIPTHGNHSTGIFQDCNVDFRNIPSFNEDGIIDATPLNITSHPTPTHGNHRMGIEDKSIQVQQGRAKKRARRMEEEEEVEEIDHHGVIESSRDVPQQPLTNFLPLGCRFLPSDEEMIKLLLLKVQNKPLPHNLIMDVNLYDYDPEDLTANYNYCNGKEWFFFTPRSKKYKNGSRPDRSTRNGFWKATGADRYIISNGSREVGVEKALVFYKGKPPKGIKTKWIMHEFRIKEGVCEGTSHKRNGSSMRLDDWVLCKLYKTSRKERIPGDDENESPFDCQRDQDDNQMENIQKMSNPDFTSRFFDQSVMPRNGTLQFIKIKESMSHFEKSMWAHLMEMEAGRLNGGEAPHSDNRFLHN